MRSRAVDGASSEGVAALHLTGVRLRGTVRQLIMGPRHMRIAFSSPRIAVFAMLVAAFGAMSAPDSASAANPLELNFWLSGPRYDGQMGECWQALHAASAHGRARTAPTTRFPAASAPRAR